jgi:ArsR family transcriptional regulator, arsenate/arsenite/antimonite-responsive transcriptional repressor
MHMSVDAMKAKDIITLLSALADPTRLRLVRMLLQEELCVCELVDALRIPQYKVSRHLGKLRRVGLVEARRNGRWMYYSIGRRAALKGFQQDLLKVIDVHVDGADVHVDGAPGMRGDNARLSRRLAMRQAGRCVVGKTCC